jgi:hypothetical protein
VARNITNIISFINTNVKIYKMAGKKNKSRVSDEDIQAIKKIVGQGGYYTDKMLPVLQRVFPSGTFSKAGGFIGGNAARSINPGLSNAGSALGARLGQRLAKVVGFGAYTVNKNSLMKTASVLPEGTEIPQFMNSIHETRIQHREYIGDILVPSSPSSFSISSYVINAANSDTFPWLAAVAARFQQYKFNGLIFEFKTLSSDITAGGALGAVVMSTNYDTIKKPFASKLEMENSEYATSAKPSRSQIHVIECDPAMTQSKLLYCADAGNDETQDIDPRFANLGNFQLATVGLPGSAGQVLGELWASYDVSLFKPDLGIPKDSGWQRLTAAGAVDVATPLGNSALSYLSESGYILRIGTATTFKIKNRGFYLAYLVMVGTNLVDTRMLSGTGTAVTIVDFTINGQTSQITVYKIEVTTDDGIVTVTAGTSSSLSATRVEVISYTPPGPA